MEIDKIGAMVVGGASGLGRASAEALAAQGARVLIADLQEELASEVAAGIGERALAVPVDVTDEESVRGAVDAAVEAFGELRFVLITAAIAHAERTVHRNGPADLATYRRVLEVNLVGTYNVLRLAAAAMQSNSPGESGERGAIVMTASVAAFEGQIGQTAYSATKGGIVGMTLPAARDLARFGVRVCTIAPGIFQTPMADAGLTPEMRAQLLAQVAFPQRMGRPEEYASVVCEIARNEFLNGEVIRVDGGVRLGRNAAIRTDEVG